MACSMLLSVLEASTVKTFRVWPVDLAVVSAIENDFAMPP